MEISIRDNGSMIKQMDMEHTPTQTEPNMSVNGKTTSKMDLEYSNGQMVKNTRGNTKMEQKPARVSSSFWTPAITRDNSSIIKSMEKVKNHLLRCLCLVQEPKIRGLMAKQQDARQRKDLMDRWKKILRSIRKWQKAWNWNFPLARWKKVCRCLEGRQTARKRRVLSCFRIKAFGRMGVRKENKMVGRASKR